MDSGREARKSPRHGPVGTLTAYLVTGVLLTALGRLVWSWVAFGFEFGSATPADLLRALYDPQVQLHPDLLGAYQWALAVAMLVVGLLAFLHRSAARSAALLLASMVLVVAVRELAALALDERFREMYIGVTGLAFPVLATWTLAVVSAIVVLALMLRAGDGRTGPASGSSVEGPGARLYRVSGGLLLVLGLAWLGWVVHRSTGRYGESYRQAVVEPGAGPLRHSFAGGAELFHVLFAAALLVFAVLALLRRPSARGGGMTMAALVAYIHLRDLYGVLTGQDEPIPGRHFFPGWDLYAQTAEGTLYLANLVVGPLVAVAALVLLLRAPEAHRPAPAPPVPRQSAPPPPPDHTPAGHAG